MSDLRELYQEVILDHNKNPRNFRDIPGSNHLAHGHNPLCGDSIVVYVVTDGDRVTDVSFKGSGCAISKASASLMTEAVKGKTRAEAEAMFHEFHDLVTGKAQVDGSTRLGKLLALAGVAEFPVRVKCATLAWHTLQTALSGSRDTVTTE